MLILRGATTAVTIEDDASEHAWKLQHIHSSEVHQHAGLAHRYPAAYETYHAFVSYRLYASAGYSDGDGEMRLLGSVCAC